MSKGWKPTVLIDQEAKETIRKEIKVNQAQLEMQQHDIAVGLGLSDGAMSTLMKNVDKLSPPRIRLLVRMGLLSPLSVLHWMGFTDKQISDITQKGEMHHVESL